VHEVSNSKLACTKSYYPTFAHFFAHPSLKEVVSPGRMRILGLVDHGSVTLCQSSWEKKSYSVNIQWRIFIKCTFRE